MKLTKIVTLILMILCLLTITSCKSKAGEEYGSSITKTLVSQTDQFLCPSTESKQVKDRPIVKKYTPAKTKGGPMVYVPAGEFMMGCNDAEEKKQRLDIACANEEKPYHRVYLDEFYIDMHKVTVEQYGECAKKGKCSPAKSGEFVDCVKPDQTNIPLNCVDWNQAKAYCQWAGKRLPTEAEWEKASRGADGRIWPWGNEKPCKQMRLDEKGDIVSMKYMIPHIASPYGAIDMTGDYEEWVADWFDDKFYQNSPSNNPTGPSSGSGRVVRSGNGSSAPEYVRSSYRGVREPNWGVPGFRCAFPRRIEEEAQQEAQSTLPETESSEDNSDCESLTSEARQVDRLYFNQKITLAVKKYGGSSQVCVG